MLIESQLLIILNELELVNEPILDPCVGRGTLSDPSYGNGPISRIPVEVTDVVGSTDLGSARRRDLVPLQLIPGQADESKTQFRKGSPELEGGTRAMAVPFYM